MYRYNNMLHVRVYVVLYYNSTHTPAKSQFFEKTLPYAWVLRLFMIRVSNTGSDLIFSSTT
jgi:hypothetical protein